MDKEQQRPAFAPDGELYWGGIMDPSCSPQWREPPRRIGPLVGMFDDPDRLERIVYRVLYAIGAVPLVIAAAMYAIDYLAGHL